MIDISKFAKEFFKIDKPAPYKEWVQVYHSMIVHTRGVKPDTLLDMKRPNEPTDIRDYRIANYRAITKHGINQAIDSVFRVLLDSNFSIKLSKNLEEYLAEKEFEFLMEDLDFKQVFFRHVLRLIFDDPNGLLVWLPENPIDKNLAPSDTPETEKIEVKPVFVPSENIRHFKKNVISYEAEEKWVVLVPGAPGEKVKQLHPFYFILTHDFIYRLIPFYDDAKKSVQYRLTDYYNLSRTKGVADPKKEFPSFVAHMLGGNISLNKKGQKYYDSFFGSYVPFGDDAICAYSDNQAVRVRYNFPFVEVKGQKCSKCAGAGKVISKDKDAGKVICSTCNGKGMTVPFTPYGHYIKEPPAPSDNEAFVASPFATFTSPDVSVLEHSYKTWKDLLDEAKRSVNIVFIDEAQSGVAKEIDREQRYETLIKISNNFFELVQWSLDIIEAYRVPFIDEREDSLVRKPMTFAIKTQSQLNAELTDLTQKEVSQSFIATTARRLAEKIYSDDDGAQKIIEVLTVWDSLFGKNAQQIATLKAAGGATTKDILRHTQGYMILSKLALDNDLEQMNITDIIELAEKEVELLEEAKPNPILIPPSEPSEDT